MRIERGDLIEILLRRLNHLQPSREPVNTCRQNSESSIAAVQPHRTIALRPQTFALH
jgi:hypothetical protein